MGHPTRRVAVIALSAAAASLCACQRDEPELPIGFIGGLSGTVAELGVQGRNGALLAVETLNEQGGPRYRLLVEDDRQDNDAARAAIQRLAREQVRFIVGPMTSSVAVAIVPEAERLGLVLISPTATTDELSGKPDAFFRVAADASTGARQLADLLLQRGVRSAAVLMDARNRSYSSSFGGAFAQHLEAGGGKVTARLEYGAGVVDFGSLARTLLAGRPQWVLIVAGVGDSALMAQQLRRIDPQVGLAVTPWAANTRLLQLGGRAVEGCLTLQAVDLDDTRPAFAEFRQRYRQRFGEDPATPAVQAYEALMVGAEALKQASSQRPLRQTLPGHRWPGLYGAIVLDANGDTQRPLHLAVVRDGRFVPVGP